jgi:hypothetical protein
MGFSSSPKIAILFLAIQEHHTTLYLHQPVLNLIRWIDDLLLKAKPYVKNNLINCIHKNTKLRVTDEGTLPLQHSINFLEYTLTLNNNKLIIEHFEKPLNLHLYLHALSNHPKQMKKAIITNELNKLIINPNNILENLQQLRLKAKQFLKRGYNPIFLKRLIINTALQMKPPRQPLPTRHPIFLKIKTPTPPTLDQKLPFGCMHNKSNPLSSIDNQNLQISLFKQSPLPLAPKLKL